MVTGNSTGWWNYLRVRGEYAAILRKAWLSTELPPRARRIRDRRRARRIWVGTTSACAENTPMLRFRSRAFWNYLRVRGEYEVYHHGPPCGGNYLRVRGEYLPPPSQHSKPRELPPRARRIQHELKPYTTSFGTTSACAENTLCHTQRDSGVWNYLRVRGEYIRSTITKSSTEELPPRARRIPIGVEIGFPPVGTTSACAENTPTPI